MGEDWCRGWDSNPHGPDVQGILRLREKGNEQRTWPIRCLFPVHMVRGVLYSPRVMDTQMDTCATVWLGEGSLRFTVRGPSRPPERPPPPLPPLTRGRARPFCPDPGAPTKIASQTPSVANCPCSSSVVPRLQGGYMKRKAPQEDQLLQRITVNPKIFGGKPIIRGHRLAVEHVLGMLGAGDRPETILEGYPWLEPEDIQACIIYARRLVGHERVDPALGGSAA